MTEPESEAEDLNEGNNNKGGSSDSSSEGEEDVNFKVYFQDPYCMDIEIPEMKVKCKGCSKKFPFAKPKGAKMSECPLVVTFYDHCLKQCPAYIGSGQMRSCTACKFLFMNQETFEQHTSTCVKFAAKQQQLSKGKGKTAPTSTVTRPRAGPASRTRRQQPEEEENEAQQLEKELVNAKFGQLVDEERKKKQKEQEEAAATAKKRPGPASRTLAGTIDENVNNNQEKRATPSAAAVQAVQAERKLSGKDLAQLTRQLKKRNGAMKTPSSLARRKEERKRKREERQKKSSSKNSSRLTSSSSSSEDDDNDDNKKRRRKKKKPFNPEKSIFRTFDTSSSELEDPDEEEFPDFIKQLPDATIQPPDYYLYIPKASVSCGRFNDSIKCPGCREPFACYRAQMDPNARGRRGEILSPAYYKHCLKECQDYARLALMKPCHDCCHRFLNHEQYLQHRKGGRTSQCVNFKKTKVDPLKYKWPTVARDTYLKILEKGKTKKNAKMKCPGCKTEYKCWKRGFDYIPDLVMFTHCVTDCKKYQELGLMVTCPHCKCDFMDQKWLDEHECEKAPVGSQKKKPPNPLGGKSVDNIVLPASSSSSVVKKPAPKHRKDDFDDEEERPKIVDSESSTEDEEQQEKVVKKKVEEVVKRAPVPVGKPQLSSSSSSSSSSSASSESSLESE